MRDIAAIANQCTDDIWDQYGHTGPSWEVIEKEITEVLTTERERCALLAEFYNVPVLAKAIRNGAFVIDGEGAWWE